MLNQKISIVVINYNGLAWLDGFFGSLEKQTYRNFELIFVDNNSSDGSVGVARNLFSDKFEFYIIENQKNLGFSVANNIGIAKASSEYILIINNDVIFDSNFLERIVNFYNDNEFDVVGPYQARYDGVIIENRNSTIDLFGYPVMTKKDPFYLSGVCLFFKKSLYIETMGLDSNFFMYSEEVDWFFRLNMFGKKFSYINDLYLYHASAGMTYSIRYNVFLWRNQNILQMLLKNYSWYNLLWILPLYLLQNIFEIVFFLVILKPKIALSYVESWLFNIKNISKILENRKIIQKNRQLSDSDIFKKMYFGSAKFFSLVDFLKSKFIKNGK